jgi:hypothetical protein
MLFSELFSWEKSDSERQHSAKGSTHRDRTINSLL